MSGIQLRHDFDVELVQHIGSDEMICRAARVSTLGAASLETTESAGLINYLMSGRHGSPFEHNQITYRVGVPFFVREQLATHRIGVSSNWESGRYKELEGVFYMPPIGRPLVQVGKTGDYKFEQGTEEQYEKMFELKFDSYLSSWVSYTKQLQLGLAKEIARTDLPVATYATAYITFNTRSLMHFLSLRTKDWTSKFLSHPQWEIEQVANQMEDIFAELFPLTHHAFDANGRVAP